MKQLLGIILCLSCILFASCTSKPKTSYSDTSYATTHQINPDNAQPQGIASMMFSHYSFVPLETNENFLIGTIDEIIPYKENYYILDKQSKTIFTFDHKGKFKSKIAAVGHGPGEYTDINHVAIDTVKSWIVAMCKEKVIYYNLSDGHFVKESIFSTGVPEALVATDTFAHYQYNLHWNGAIHNLKTITNNKVLFEYLPINTNFKGYCLRGNRFFTGNPTATVYFNDYLGDTVYEVTPTRLIARTVIDFGEKQITPEGIRQLGEAQTASYVTKSPYCSEIRDYFETPSIIFFGYGYKGPVYYYLYSKNNGCDYHYKDRWYDDISYSIIPESWVFASDSALLTWKHTAQFIRETVESPAYYRNDIEKRVKEGADRRIMNSYDDQVKHYQEILKKVGMDQLKEDDNPILIWMHFNQKFR